MQNFSNILKESRERVNFDSVSLLSAEVNKYINKVNKVLPKNVKDVISLTQKYNLLTSNELVEIMDASKSQLRDIASKHTEIGVNIDSLLELQKMLKDLKQNIRLLPQFQSQAEREALEAGKLAADDLTIDLESKAGRNAVAKLYTPLVFKIVNQKIGKSSLDKAALISAGMMGLADAINDFDREKTNKPFKTYAAYRIEQAIMNDMNSISHNLSGTNWYAVQQGEVTDATHMSSLATNDDGEYDDDRLKALGVDDLYSFDIEDKDNIKLLERLYAILEGKFSTRDCDIFYRFMGLKDYVGQKQKSKDIAKMYGMSEGNIQNSIIKKFISFIKSTPKAMSIMRALNECFEVTLMKDLIYFDKQTIYEMLIEDDMFLLLEELNKFGDKDVFESTINTQLDSLHLEEANYIMECLQNGISGGYIDREPLVHFLNNIYITENFNTCNNFIIAQRMNYLSQISKEYNIVWKS